MSKFICHICGNEVAPNDYACPHCPTIVNGGVEIPNPTPPATGEVKRYDVEPTLHIDGIRAYDDDMATESVESDNGAWVKYEDHAATLAAMREDNAVFAQFIRELLGTMPDEISIDKDGDVAEALARAKEPT